MVKPEFVLFDTWYSSINNLKEIRKKGWHWLTRLKKNWLVNPDKTGNVAIELLTIPPEGMTVHLKEYGFIKCQGRFTFPHISRYKFPHMLI